MARDARSSCEAFFVCGQNSDGDAQRGFELRGHICADEKDHFI